MQIDGCRYLLSIYNVIVTPKQLILDYIGCTDLSEDDVEVFADPIIDNVWAGRVTADIWFPDFLIHADGEIEEVEFRVWPPVTVH